MSHSDHVRRLITLVESNEQSPSEGLIASRLADICKLVDHTQESWNNKIMQVWREFYPDRRGPPHPQNLSNLVRLNIKHDNHFTQDEISRVSGFLETRLARQLRNLEQALEDIQVKLSELETMESSINPRFFDIMRSLITTIKILMEVLEEEGYYPSNPGQHSTTYRNETSKISSTLLAMGSHCFGQQQGFVYER